MSMDHGAQRSKTSIVELSPDQAHTSAEDLSTVREPSRMSLAPLVYGTLTNMFSTIVAMSKKTKSNVLTVDEEEEGGHEHTQKQEPEQKTRKITINN
ncbi:unnamed protein product [Rotaria magnacalcarata]|nr:unnamed protein product [Rotaria magnacalcarata]